MARRAPPLSGDEFVERVRVAAAGTPDDVSITHPDREQTIVELEQATGIPQQSVSREVNRLLETGLV